MPYQVVKKGTGPKPFKVVKKDTGEVVGAHATRGKAQAQMQALYANSDEDMKEKKDE